MNVAKITEITIVIYIYTKQRPWDGPWRVSRVGYCLILFALGGNVNFCGYFCGYFVYRDRPSARMLISSAGDILNASARGWEGGSDSDKVLTWGRGSLNQFSPKMSTALRDRSPMSNCQAKTFVDRLVCSWRGKRQVELKSCFTLTSILDKRKTWSNVVLNSTVATPAARYFFKVSMILLASASLSSCEEEQKAKKFFSTNQTY